MQSLDDHDWMTRALKLARRGEGAVEPNPMVGCVLVRDGKLIGEGFHRRFGGPHAEIEALRSLSDPHSANQATAYVTLEPCCHTGKTPPCADALIEARVARVVVAMRDPFPKVDGGGIAKLEAAGIHVDIGVEQKAAENLNAPYLKRLHRRRPWVIAKWAMTLDGRIATASGDSQWISGELSRGEVHRLRGRVDAIIVGGGTAAADDPTLTARPPGPRVATRIVVANQRLPKVDSNLLRSIEYGPVLIVTGPQSNAAHLLDLKKCGAEIFRSKQLEADAMVGELLDDLGRREMTNVMVEGGATLLSSFVAIDELDEIHAYIASKIVGGANSPGPVGGKGFAKLADALFFRWVETTRLDDDIRIISRRIR